MKRKHIKLCYAIIRLCFGMDSIEETFISKVTDWIGLVKAISAQIPNEEYSPLVLARFQYEVLGYIDLVDPDLDWRYIMVTGLDLKSSPRFQAYSFGRGKAITFKVHKKKPFRDPRVVTSFADVPISDGDTAQKGCLKRDFWREEITQKKLYAA